MREGHRVHPARSSGRIIDRLLACTSHTVRCAWRQQLGGNHLGAIKSMQTLWNLITMTNWTNVSSCPFSITLCAEDIMDINVTAEDFEYPVNLFPVPILTGITVTCSFLFLVGIAGNLLTILVVTKYKDMRTTTNLYLCSMALSDLLIFLCMPLDLYRVWRYRPWNFGDELCKLFQFVSESCTYSTILNITALSVERYFAICFPFRAKVIVTRGRVKGVILLLWTVALCSAGPIFILVGVEHENGTNAWETNECKATDYAIRSGLLTMMVWVSSVFFFLPVLCLTVLYSLIGRRLWRRKENPVGPISSREKNNKQTVKMLGELNNALKSLTNNICIFQNHLKD